MFEDQFALGIGGIYSILVLSLTFFFLIAIRIRTIDTRITQLYDETGQRFSNISETLETLDFLEDYSKQLEEIVDEKTEEVKMERDRLEEAYKELKKLDRMKDEFLSNVSHELRTPITTIKGVVDYIQDDDIKDEHRELLRVGNRNINRLNTLVGDILDFAKIEQWPEKLQIEQMTLKEVIDRAVNDVKESAERNKVVLRVSIGDEGKKVESYRTLLKKAIVNLLDNAIKFNQSGGEVHIETAYNEEEGFAQISVTDTGIGIPEEHMEKVFERFYQIDGSTTRRYGGVGLGLTITKRIVEILGGELRVESVVGKGTKFWFTIPIKRGGLK
ncbi:HAMP domain-containing histidine kinase [archaeon]|nr:HAMP domain-containing histidine kinase [archaeon]